MKCYVDMNNNICIFGYGAIDVGVVDRTIIFKEIKPPKGAGTRIWNTDCTEKVGDWEYTGNMISLRLNSIEYVEIVYDQLKRIETDGGGSITVNGVILDFTKYEQVSMSIVKTAISQVQINILKLMAC